MKADLRSDAVSRPVPAMLDAMMHAAVGDDVFGDDPSVRELETQAARLFGKEAALFCPSGVMSNQVALTLLAGRDGKFLCNELSHVYYQEAGGPAYLGGATPLLVAHDRGRLKPEQVSAGIAQDPAVKVVVVENTVNKGGGCCYTPEAMAAVAMAARDANVKTHLDGARIFNALAETGGSPMQTGALFDMVSFCLSKGLGAPAGSVLAGPGILIREARILRNRFGGGMRQAGLLAAAGLYALEHHISRLGEDHAHARMLGSALSGLSWVAAVQPVETNIVMFDPAPGIKPDRVLVVLREKDIEAVAFGSGIRFVTHIGVSREMTEYVIRQLNALAFHDLQS